MVRLARLELATPRLKGECYLPTELQTQIPVLQIRASIGGQGGDSNPQPETLIYNILNIGASIRLCSEIYGLQIHYFTN